MFPTVRRPTTFSWSTTISRRRSPWRIRVKAPSSGSDGFVVSKSRRIASCTAELLPRSARPFNTSPCVRTPSSRSPSMTGKSCWNPARVRSTARDRGSVGSNLRKSVIIPSRTDRPERATFIVDTECSAWAPSQMKTAITIRSGLWNSPTTPKITAVPWPTRAAIWVARSGAMRIARSARRTRPPSIG